MRREVIGIHRSTLYISCRLGYASSVLLVALSHAKRIRMHLRVIGRRVFLPPRARSLSGARRHAAPRAPRAPVPDPSPAARNNKIKRVHGPTGTMPEELAACLLSLCAHMCLLCIITGLLEPVPDQAYVFRRRRQCMPNKKGRPVLPLPWCIFPIPPRAGQQGGLWRAFSKVL